MTLRLGALQDALLDPGNAEKATKAAEELAGYDNRLASIEGKVTVLTWMVGTLIVLVLFNLGLTFQVFARLPR